MATDDADVGGIQLTPEQLYAHKLVESRENTLVVGGCGTGKSLFITVAVMTARKAGRLVLLTAPTWRAVMQFQDGATTYHSLFGMTPEWERKPLDRVVATGVKRLKKLKITPEEMKDVLFVLDEISLVPRIAWDAIVAIFEAFGPYMPQFLIVGDFVQLPPVATDDDNCEFVIASPKFWAHIPNVVVMHTRKRATDPEFAWLLDSIHYGSVVSNEEEYERAEAMLKPCINKKLKDNTLHVAGRNADVKRIVEASAAKLTSAPMQVSTVSFNIGIEDISEVEKVMTPMHDKIRTHARCSATLRVGQTVQLMTTLNRTLHRGITGVVTRTESRREPSESKAAELVVEAGRLAFESTRGPPIITDCDGCDKVWVLFQKQPEETLVGYFVHTLAIGQEHVPPDVRIDPMSLKYPRAAIACIPLRGSEAETCHGVQGMTLDAVYAHGGTLWQRGMLPMVIGRLRDLEGLSIIASESVDLRPLLRIDPVAHGFYGTMFLAARGHMKAGQVNPLAFCPKYCIGNGIVIPCSQGSAVKIISKRAAVAERTKATSVVRPTKRVCKDVVE